MQEEWRIVFQHEDGPHEFIGESREEVVQRFETYKYRNARMHDSFEDFDVHLYRRDVTPWEEVPMLSAVGTSNPHGEQTVSDEGL